jgi:hypothetical protein
MLRIGVFEERRPRAAYADLFRKREKCTEPAARARLLIKTGCIFGLLFVHERN